MSAAVVISEYDSAVSPRLFPVLSYRPTIQRIGYGILVKFYNPDIQSLAFY